MTIYEIRESSLKAVPVTTFAKANVNERSDLQRLLRTQIEIISPGTLVIAEEFGDWVDSKRRIDLLGIDREGNLVVIELKRTEDGGHMELQALRYAAMVSTMTFDRAVQAYELFLTNTESAIDARASMLGHLGWESEKEGDFGNVVRIVLASAEFSKELTTTVLWLNEQGLDIRCVRLKPYNLEGRLLADVQQVIPLPEAEDYVVSIRDKEERKRDARKSQRDLTRYDVTLNGDSHFNLPKRIAILSVVKHLCQNGVTPNEIVESLPWRKSSMFRNLDGTLTPDEFISKAQSEDQNHTFDPIRYFLDDLIHSGNKTYALTNQWGPRCFEAIQIMIKAFPKVQIHCVEST